jgi:hypothetical protein
MKNSDENAHGGSQKEIVRSLLTEPKQELAALRDDQS